MRAEIELDGRTVVLELEGRGDTWTAGGRQLSVIEVEPGTYSVLLDGRSHEVRVEYGLAGSAVIVGPRRYRAEVRDPRRRVAGSGRRGQGTQQLIAPMPGKVVQVLVNEGDTVEAGQGVLVLEAMKMQNAVKALRPGRIVTLHARQGMTVTAGEILGVIG